MTATSEDDIQLMQRLANGEDLALNILMARWRERDVEPGWVEATFRPPIDRPDPRIDWLQIEDHTGSAETEVVTVYQYVVAWLGRAQATLTIRHPLGLDLDPTVRAASAAMVTAVR